MKIIRILISVLLVGRGLTGIYKYMSNAGSLSSYGKGQIWGYVAMVIIGILVSLSFVIKPKPKDKTTS